MRDLLLQPSSPSPVHPSSTELPRVEAGVTSLVDGVLGDIGDIVRGILQTEGEIGTHVLLQCGDQGWRCQG